MLAEHPSGRAIARRPVFQRSPGRPEAVPVREWVQCDASPEGRIQGTTTLMSMIQFIGNDEDLSTGQGYQEAPTFCDDCGTTIA